MQAQSLIMVTHFVFLATHLFLQATNLDSLSRKRIKPMLLETVKNS